MLINKNKKKMLKKALCLIFVFLLSINSFAAVVADNDGSAFITKAEFDSLKNNFQSQLDSYNTTIDSKIDSAIASYLAGINLSREVTTDGYLPQIYKQDPSFVSFCKGSNLGYSTDDQKATTKKWLNPFVAINFMGTWATTDYNEADYYSHTTPPWRGQWDNTTAGGYIVSLDKKVYGGNNYFGLNTKYIINKWQFLGVYSGSKEGMTTTITSTQRGTNFSWGYSRPSSDSVTESIGGVSMNLTRALFNTITDTKKLVGAKAGSFYGFSESTYIYGWEDKNNYIYDTSWQKTEESANTCYRRHIYGTGSSRARTDNTDKFTYKFYMPTQVKIQFDKLINIGVSDVIGKAVYAYQGLPIVKMEKDTQKIRIPLTITNIGDISSNYKLYIADEPFDNHTTYATEVNTIYVDDEYIVEGEREIVLNISDTMKRELWLKLMPETSDAKVSYIVTLTSGKQITQYLKGN